MWEPTERENHVAERELVPVNGGGGGAVQHEHDGAKKRDGFVRRDQSCRYASSDIPSDLLVKVGGVNFHLHKHPMVSRSACLARLVDEAAAIHGPVVVATAVELPDLPGGHGAFELAAKFCYGVMVDITVANVAALLCAAEYLEMTEELEEGNLAFRAEAFLACVVASSWRDSVAVLRSCEGLSPWADDLQLVRRCSESVASKACTSPRAVRWAYAGRRSPKTPRAGTSSGNNQPVPPADWWVEDICVLRIDHFVRVVTAIQAKGMRHDLISAAVTRYASKWLPGLTNGTSSSHGGAPWTQAGGLQMVIAGEDDMQTAEEQRMVVESLISIIPQQPDSVSCGFLLRLLRLAVMLKAAPALVTELEKRVGMQLDQAELPDLLVPSNSYGRADTAYDVDLVQRLVEQFLVQEQSATAASSGPGRGKVEQEHQPQEQNAKAMRVACLLDSYLSAVSRDRNLAVSKFQVLAGSLPESARSCDDGLYRAIDSYLKAHPAVTEHERKRLCRAVDCRKLSVEARTHAAQNERLPLRVVVRVLLSEQVKIADALAKADMGDGSTTTVGKKKDVNELWLEVESVNAKYKELQREVELLQKQVERLVPPSAGKQQSASGWSSGWRKLGRLAKISGANENDEERVAAPGEAASKGPRLRRNSAS